MKYKMFVADYDGTLGHAPNVIQPETLQTVKEYISKGGRFLVCSGREQKSISDILNNYGIEGDVICCQGAVLSDIKTGEKKISGGVETNFALKLIDELESILLRERENVLDTIPVVELDSRLGWEPSMDYTTDKKGLEWKLRQLDYELNFKIPTYRKANALDI